MSDYKIVSSIEKLEALNSILYGRPAGRNIIDYAREEIESLRSDIKRLQAQIQFQQDAFREAIEERDALKANNDRLRIALENIAHVYCPNGNLARDIAKALQEK